MDEDRGRSLTRREFEAVIKRASELATSDPYGEEGALNEAELFRIAREGAFPTCMCAGHSLRCAPAQTPRA